MTMGNEIPSFRDPLQNEGSMFSIGTSFAIDTLEKVIPQSQSDLVAINLATLIRNHLNTDKGMKMDDLLTRVRNELAILLEDVSAFLNRARVNKPKILLYLIDYSKSVPSEVSRDQTPPRALLQRAIQYVLIRQGQLFTDHLMMINGIEVRFVPFQRVMLPHKVLYSAIQNMSSNRQVIMLSHCPLDFHVGRQLKGFSIIESHTGKIRTLSELGKKLFKRDHLPFNPLLHAFLGDKDYIKGSLGIKERRQIYEMATQRSWDLKTYNTVRKDLKSLGFKPLIDFE
jgi:hypothetical protein